MQPGTDQRAELAQQQRGLRTWLLVVAVLLFGVDVVGMYMSTDAEMTTRWHRWLLVYYLIILAYFVVMWWGARVRAVACCAVALGGYWVMHACLWMISPEHPLQGILMKLVLMIGLLKCAYSARRLERKLGALEAVFG